MKKISGRITSPPPPMIDGINYITAPIGKPIEGVKITDGEKVVFSDKNGLYEIETSKANVEFSKEGYAKENVTTISLSEDSANKKDIVLQVYGMNKSTSEDKTIMGFRKSTFFIALGGIILFGVGLMVLIPKLKKK